jgi:hypothetical protein
MSIIELNASFIISLQLLGDQKGGFLTEFSLENRLKTVFWWSESTPPSENGQSDL